VQFESTHGCQNLDELSTIFIFMKHGIHCTLLSIQLLLHCKLKLNSG